jgi:hypothetical protein
MMGCCCILTGFTTVTMDLTRACSSPPPEGRTKWRYKLWWWLARTGYFHSCTIYSRLLFPLVQPLSVEDCLRWYLWLLLRLSHKRQHLWSHYRYNYLQTRASCDSVVRWWLLARTVTLFPFPAPLFQSYCSIGATCGRKYAALSCVDIYEVAAAFYRHKRQRSVI